MRWITVRSWEDRKPIVEFSHFVDHGEKTAVCGFVTDSWETLDRKNCYRSLDDRVIEEELGYPLIPHCEICKLYAIMIELAE